MSGRKVWIEWDLFVSLDIKGLKKSVTQIRIVPLLLLAKKLWNIVQTCFASFLASREYGTRQDQLHLLG
jgi:hypothetical protein